MRLSTITSSSLIPLALLVIAPFSSASPPSICSNNPSDIIPDGCASYEGLEDLNERIRPLVHEVTKGTDFFSYYRLDLYGRTCPFWSDDAGMCANIACAVNTIDNEENIPAIWRAKELSRLTGPVASHPKGNEILEPSPLGGALGEDTDESCVVESDECDERDYCVPEDDSLGSKGDYVSLLENPERFTGYAGAGAENVWKSIYRENCFLKPRPESAQSGPMNPAAQGFMNVLQDKSTHRLALDAVGKPTLSDIEPDDECLEKRVFYRVISGMHASISMHLCWDYLNQSTGEWGPNLDCFINRFSGHPDRLQNIYFNYALLLRAVGKLKSYIPQYTFCSGDSTQNRITKSKMLKLASAVPESGVFDESSMFQDDMALLKEDFRNRFRNVSRVMDCVGCDKCRLWGKVQTQGYGTALKILFEFDENKSVDENPPLRRTELVALVNTLDRVSHSLEALHGFHRLWEIRNETAAAMEAKGNDSGTTKKEKQRSDEHPSIKEQFMAEWTLVWRMFFFVIRSWIELPKILFTMGWGETLRAWDKLQGEVPRARPYRFQNPEHMEL